MIGEEEGKKLTSSLMEAGLYSEPEPMQISLEDGRSTYGYGYPIKAFEKFLGYYDPELHLPFNPSISFNTDFSVCQCMCTYDASSSADRVMLDGKESEEYSQRASKALAIVRKIFNIEGHFSFVIKRSRRYGRAKGMSESAAVASAVSRALLRNISSTEPDDRIVSRFAKFVSGSGTRSSIPGFSMWLSYAGIEERNSFAINLPVDYSRFHFAAVPLFTDISTSDMHRAVIKSPLYFQWVEKKFGRITEIIDNGFQLSDLMERGFEEMIALANLVKSVGKEIHTSDTLTIIEDYIHFGRRNEGLFITTDTGPSVVVMAEDKSLVKQFLSELPFESIDGKVMDGRDPDTKNSFMKEVSEQFQS